ncbi:MAG: hypothetical protein GXO11_08430 [Epsilonproteobacteria bacterium]|nr:hypothetical protein [Campylobacterota bacterium]
MNFEQQWLEYDFNPFILFNHHGKVLSLNTEAQFLFDAISPKEIFDLATTHASPTYGFKTTFFDIEFKRHKFFGITVGYINDDEIGIKLYRAPTLKTPNIQKPTGEIVNVYTIIDLCISSNSIEKEIKFIKDFDPTIPDIMINPTLLIKLLNQMYQCFMENDTITTKVYYRIGEYIKYEDKKYSLFSIEVFSEHINLDILDILKKYAEENSFYLEHSHNVLTLNLPIITK